METSKLPVLSVKLKVPNPRKRYVVRTTLLEKLNGIKDHKVTVVKAGAGSGKTTLFSVYAKKEKEVVIKWITADESMNQPFVFWKYVIESVRDELGEDVDVLLNCFDNNVQKEILWQLISMLLNQLSEKAEMVLIWDDFHLIKDPFLIKTIDYFTENLPETIHLVLVGRTMPAIYLGQLQVEGELLLIEEDQIRMTKEESREFLVHTLALEESDTSIDTLVEKSNGWIGGLQLMAIASRHNDKSPFLGANISDQVVFDYIEKEIFTYLSDEEKKFLMATGLLQYFNKEICKAYLPEYDFTTMVQSILSKNMFVIELDEEKEEYRYHSILKEFLQKRMNEDLEECHALRERAADIYYKSGDYEECLQQLFAIPDYKRIMELSLTMPQNALTFSYMMKVPLEQIIYNTNFAYQYFFNYYATLEVDKCNEIYQFLIEHLKEDETYEAFKNANLFFDIHWEFKGVTTVTLDQIDQMPLNKVTKAYILIKEAYFLFMEDKMEEALEYLDLAAEYNKKTKNYYIEFFVLAEKTQLLEEQGALMESLSLYESMKKSMKKAPTLSSSYYIGIAGVYIKQLKLDLAKEALETVKGMLHKNMENISSAYLYTYAEYAYICGDDKTTEQIITRLSRGEMYRSVFFSARLLRYPIYRGNHGDIAEKFVKEYDVTDDVLKNMDTELVYTGILYERGNVEKALEHLQDLMAKARKTQKKLKIVEYDLLKTRIYLEQKIDHRTMVDAFLEAVNYAFPEEMALPFWFEKNTVARLLEEHKSAIQDVLTKEELVFLKNSISVHVPKKEIKAETKQRPYDLTEREMDVLEELKKGHSNKEIAANLCISLATVKTHIINIYGKLGVSNRVEAVNKVNK